MNHGYPQPYAPPPYAQPPPPSPLGALVKHYGRSRDWTISLAIGSSLVLLGSIGVPALTALQDNVDDDELFWMLVVAPVGVLIGLGAFVALLVHLGQKLDVYQYGLVHRGKRTIRWEEIESISSRIYEVIGGRNPGTRGHVTLMLRGGGKLRLTPSLDDVADARAQIEGATYGRMMAAAQATIAAGRPAAFGPLWVSPQGLGRAAGAEVQPWAAFSKIEYEEGKFIAVTQGPFAWAKLRRDKIPNIHVFLPLVAQFHDVRGF